MSILLVLTVGQTDVQIVRDGVRHELDKDRCAALHDEIERRGYVLCDAPVSKGAPVETLPAGELKLCTPKLDAVLREVVPTAALLLETRRDSKSAPGDPRFAGAVLEFRLNERGTKTVYRRAYLQDTERLEDRNQPRDAVIRREVVDRLDDAIRESLTSVRPSRVVVAATGGFPVVASLVEEIVRLHAPRSARVEVLEIADGAQASPPSADRAVPRVSVPEPIVSYQARRRVLELIDKGNLLGAWAIAEPLHGDDVERRWTRIIEWLYFFASSLPIPDDCDVEVLKHNCMAVRATLRVEFALRAGDIPRAVHGTVAFFEAALWDHLKPHIEERSKDDKGRAIVRLSEAPSRELCQASDGINAFKPAQAPPGKPGDWYYVEDSGHAARKLIETYLKKPKLAALYKATTCIRELRNDVAHNEPTPELMDDACQRMTEAGIWSSDRRFLTQEIIRGVLTELGETEPESMCDKLIATVRSRLLEHRFDGASST